MSKEQNNEQKERIKELRTQISKLQSELSKNKKGLVILVEGWGCSGKGTLINKLVDDLDTKFYKVENMQDIVKYSNRKPLMHKYYSRLPELGKITIFNCGWLTEISSQYIKGEISKQSYHTHINNINTFERQLKDNGYIVVKLFIDINKKTQAKRINKTLQDENNSWRISKEDICQNNKYKVYKKTFFDIISQTNSHNKWHIINKNTKLDIFETALISIIETINNNFVSTYIPTIILPNKEILNKKINLKNIKLNKTIEEKAYKQELKQLQKELKYLQGELYKRKIPVVIAYEGWDAAGKGGNIKRIIKPLDTRDFEVFPIASPTPEEKNRHFLWRFWTKIPKSGHIAIFDRTWYGRVMVERIEGFCTENDWQRAYNEINEFEKELTEWGAIVIKFWVHIDKETQLERFKIRQNTPEKQWKITDEDWRNREKWDVYETSINEMLAKTNTKYAPWIILESNDKKYARIKALKTLIKIFKERLYN